MLYGLLLLLMGIPVYVWQRRSASSLQPATAPTDG